MHTKTDFMLKILIHSSEPNFDIVTKFCSNLPNFMTSENSLTK